VFQRLFVKPNELELERPYLQHNIALTQAAYNLHQVTARPFPAEQTLTLASLQANQATVDNIRLWDRDATELLPLLPPASLDQAVLLYPDPWPKRRQRKRRFLSDETLDLLARVLRPGADLRFATDIDDYAGWALARVLRSRHFTWTAERPDDWRKPWPDWPGTRYEAKAVREGRAPMYLTFRRV